jgi:catechol 2,3-dioxygenase-like lactoylglutathione lyase family enzyme
MIDHMGLAVSNYAKSKDFYLAALKPLGYELIMEFGEAGGFGVDKKPDLWVAKAEIGKPNHIAFRAKDRATVDAFYEAAIAAGGKDNGKPGLRPEYHEHYYGAFILDLDGHNIEACCHLPE